MGTDNTVEANGVVLGVERVPGPWPVDGDQHHVAVRLEPDAHGAPSGKWQAANRPPPVPAPGPPFRLAARPSS